MTSHGAGLDFKQPLDLFSLGFHQGVTCWDLWDKKTASLAAPDGANAMPNSVARTAMWLARLLAASRRQLDYQEQECQPASHSLTVVGWTRQRGPNSPPARRRGNSGKSRLAARAHGSHRHLQGPASPTPDRRPAPAAICSDSHTLQRRLCHARTTCHGVGKSSNHAFRCEGRRAWQE